MTDELQDMHRLAERCILAGLKDGGFVKGDVDAAVQDRIGALFMPHGGLWPLCIGHDGTILLPVLCLFSGSLQVA